MISSTRKAVKTHSPVSHCLYMYVTAAAPVTYAGTYVDISRPDFWRKKRMPRSYLHLKGNSGSRRFL